MRERIFMSNFYAKYRAPNSDELINKINTYTEESVDNSAFSWGSKSSSDKIPLKWQDFMDLLKPSLKLFAEEFGVNFNFTLKNPWINLYKRGDHQEIHDHHGSHLSSVFVVNDDEDSNFDDSPQVFITNSGSIGIRTTSELANVSINAHECGVVVGGLGVGSTVVVGAVDMREAGRPANNATDRFMLPPQVTTTQRNNLVGLVAGALVYNTSLNRLELYTGSSWKKIDMSNI